MNINFINDRKEYNQLHRKSVIGILHKNKYLVREFGVFDISLYGIFRHLFSSDEFFIISNLKANIVTLFFIRKPSVHIINGMGRMRSIKPLRICLVNLLKFSSAKTLIVQNYADYRYFKRQKIACHWISGSGGTKKKVGSDKVFIMVSRPSKIKFALDWLREVKLQDAVIKVIGVSTDYKFPPEFLNTEGVGRLPQSDILAKGAIFLQPGGKYGEGFPHSLCDALCSGMVIVTDKRTYRKFGMHKLECRYSEFNDDLISIHSMDGGELLHTNKIANDYYHLIRETLEVTE
jgi:hypothetical protein